MKINAVLAAVAVADMETAVAWYKQLLGQPPTSRPMPSLAEWQIEGGHLQVVHDPARAGASLLTLDVSHLEGTAAEVTDSGLVAHTPTISQGDTVRFVQIVDPDGNTITLVESPASAP
jgi:predicted enzyme related to lactoylglutathione lyase